MKATIPQESARQLDQARVVRVLLVIPHQDATALRQPCERPLHDPAPRLVPLRPVARLLLLTDGGAEVVSGPAVLVWTSLKRSSSPGGRWYKSRSIPG